jgi:hypothetical protein
MTSTSNYTSHLLRRRSGGTFWQLSKLLKILLGAIDRPLFSSAPYPSDACFLLIPQQGLPLIITRQRNRSEITGGLPRRKKRLREIKQRLRLPVRAVPRAQMLRPLSSPPPTPSFDGRPCIWQEWRKEYTVAYLTLSSLCVRCANRRDYSWRVVARAHQTHRKMTLLQLQPRPDPSVVQQVRDPSDQSGRAEQEVSELPMDTPGYDSSAELPMTASTTKHHVHVSKYLPTVHLITSLVPESLMPYHPPNDDNSFQAYCHSRLVA